MAFADELNLVLPVDLPHREVVVAKAARHLEMIEEANRQFNLTRIVGPKEAAIKHVLDSVMPWRLFAGARHVMDAGSGAGFPGIPLAVVLPEVRFTLAESIGKKARFIEAAVTDLQLVNASVQAVRAEDLVKTTNPDIITARAVAPLTKALDLFAPALKKGVRLLLYKGPDAQLEIEEAAAIGRKLRVRMRVVFRYDLPELTGSRTIIEIIRE
jgi:16S rRNA (guanine527-N7)-methyltransferase